MKKRFFHLTVLVCFSLFFLCCNDYEYNRMEYQTIEHSIGDIKQICFQSPAQEGADYAIRRGSLYLEIGIYFSTVPTIVEIDIEYSILSINSQVVGHGRKKIIRIESLPNDAEIFKICDFDNYIGYRVVEIGSDELIEAHKIVALNVITKIITLA